MQLVKCVACSTVAESDALDPVCEKCGSAVLLVGSEPPDVTRGQLEALPMGVWRYSKFLPTLRADSIVSLGEGGTPLLRAQRLGEELGLRNLLIKDESRNPTGSFLDRGSTVLLSLARQRNIKECACLTTGNLGASLAAYCAKAGVGAKITIHPNTDSGKLFQMLAYGADIVSSTTEKPRKKQGVLTVTAGNPYLIEGERTTGFEIVQDLAWETPDVIVVPVGTGGHLSTIWRSLSLLREMGLVDGSVCRLLGVQVKGGQPPGRGGGGGRSPAGQPWPFLAELEESLPYFAHEASRAVAESGGTTLSTTPAQTVDSTRLLATTEGVFAEPSSASVVAAVREAAQNGMISASERVVCVITSTGLKDTKAVSRLAKETRRVAAVDAYALPSPKIGDTKLELLALLRKGPNYGYELWSEVGGGRRISTASIYQHLGELEGFAMVRKKGVAVSKGRERVMYELTKKGTDFLKIAAKLGGQEA